MCLTFFVWCRSLRTSKSWPIGAAAGLAYVYMVAAWGGYTFVNFRATQYLADNGWAKFSKWFDYMSWYPLGRPVGTTIYPGMQVTAVTIWRTLGVLGDGFKMSLNDVCVFFPAWFGAVATLLTGLLTAECSGDKNAAVVASLVMSIVPAHTMRSVGGGVRQRIARRHCDVFDVLRVVS